MEADFEGGRLTADGGLLLLREVDRRLGLLDAIDAVIPDPRDPRYIIHTQRELLAQRVFAIAAGYEDVQKLYPGLEDRRLIYETIRRMIGTVVTDLVENTRANIEAAAPQSIDDVRTAGRVLVAFSDEVYEQHISLKRFLQKHLYSHEKKLEMTRRAQKIVRELFDLYSADTSLLPAEFAGRTNTERPPDSDPAGITTRPRMELSAPGPASG